jgi:proline iminopeptidase
MFINVNGARLFFDTVGPKLRPEGAVMRECPTLLVLHGGPGYDHSTLRPYFDRFADAFQVVYLDHRGCGRSNGDQSGWHLDQWADDIATFCATLGLEKPMVFGQSFGGMVAIHYATRHPDGPSKAIFSSTAAKFLLEDTVSMIRDLGGDAAAEAARAFFSAPSADGFDRYMQLCGPLYSQTEPDPEDDYKARAIQRPEVALHFFSDGMKRMDMRPALAGLTCPALVLGGALDPVTPPSCSHDIAEAIGDKAVLNIFDGCGHGVHRDEPDKAEAVMREFLTAS